MKLILVLLLLSSCAHERVSKSLRKSAKNICLSTEGKGRLLVKGRKYVFGYESGLDEEHANWQLALNFPMRDQEIFKLDWSENGKVKFESSINEKLLKENKNVNPRSLEVFTSKMGKLLNEIIQLRTGKTKKRNFLWSRTSKELKVTDKSKKFNAVFTNLTSDGYFGLMTMGHEDTDSNLYKIDLVVRNCLEQ